MLEPLTQRQLLVPLLIWATLTVLAGLTGPFGTFESLEIVVRCVYWAGVIGLSIGLSMVVHLLKDDQAALRTLGLWLVYAVVLSCIIQVLNMALFPVWRGWERFALLFANVAMVAVIVHILVWIVEWSLRPQSNPSKADNPEQLFLTKVPLNKRGALIRLEAQDHYLKVVTDGGEALILMRLSDAVDRLARVDGLHVHRSHWVRLDAVAQHMRRDGRDVLLMKDGFEVPVSRRSKSAAKAAGLLA